MTFRFLVTFILILSAQKIYSQVYEVSGKIVDAKTNKHLEYVTVKVADTAYGTTSDREGNYFIRLGKGGNKLIFSYIGYYTDTVNVYVEDKNIERYVFLKPSELLMEEIEVLGEDPAYEIIRRAINYKKKFKENLNEYEFNAYSKFVIRSNQSEIPKKLLDSTDRNKTPIYGILESEATGYFKKPDKQKLIVKSKRETANIARGSALPLIVNFYDEKIDFGEFKIPTPLADNAFDNYDFKLKGTTSIDSTVVFKIDVINITENRPLFKGTVYIIDSLFALVSVDLSTNEAAKPLGIKFVNFKQKFTSFADNKNSKQLFWMPTDIQILANGSFVGVIKYEAEIFTIVSHYDINKKLPAGIFDEFVIKVMPDSKKDTTYWKQNQLIKNTSEEKKAFKIIEYETERDERRINIGLTNIGYGKRLNSSPMNYYSFNRVEGSTLTFDLNYKSTLNRININSEIGYGFSDKKTKYAINYVQRFFNDRRLTINASFFQLLRPLSYPDMLGISELYNTLKALLDKKDNLDYYYSVGYDLGINYRIIPQFRFGLTFHQAKQTTAYTNTDFSLRKSDEPFPPNPPINDAFQRIIGVNIRIDPNQFKAIDWGNGDISRFRNSKWPFLDLGFKYSGKIFNSTYEYRKFLANISGQNYFTSFFNLRYRLGGELASGVVPFQSLLYFSANTGTLDFMLQFKALKYQEYLGDKLFYFSLENNFGKLLWGNVPVLRNFNLIGFFNAGRVEISEANYQLAAYKSFSETDGMYFETGLGVSRILDIFRIDFAWRLNNPYQGKYGVFFVLSLDTW